MTIPLENNIILLDFINKDLTLEITSEGDASIFKIDENNAAENGEASTQILEGRSYEYVFSDDKYRLGCSYDGIVSRSKKHEHRGRLVPNIYVGALQLIVYSIEFPENSSSVSIEVLATKFDNAPDKSYRQNYRSMLESITEKCTDLLMQINSPVLQNFEASFTEDNETIYQRFCFVSSLVNSKEFEEAVQKIISSPKTHWTNEMEQSDVRKIKRFSSYEIRQLTSSGNRLKIQESHHLFSKGLNSIPSKIFSTKKVESLDNAENRFVKHALEVYLAFCEKCFDKFNLNTREKIEAEVLVKKLEIQLNQPFFKEISRPTTLKLNSPVLQRKSGYREVLKTWLMFDLAAKLVWKGGDDVYAAGKKDIATLYEYWLFFALYDLFKDKFKLNSIQQNGVSYDHLIEETKDGLNVILKAGVHTALSGTFHTENRKLKIKYSYNRSFKGGKVFNDDKGTGSWTTTLRPDYTLSFWPEEFSEKEAEKNELIVHIHFDAKYKVTQFTIHTEINSAEFEEEELNERKGFYKNADLLKMHAYKDAIRRTGGAYILYPGTKNEALRGFHEIIPGLGAFAINPSDEAIGLKNLSDFIDKVIRHLLDRASQRDNLSSKIYSIHKENKKDSDTLNEPMPEYVNGKRLIPDETFVLVGFSKDAKRLKWYEENGKYNFRMDDDKGSLVLESDVVNSKYLLIRESGNSTASKIYRIISKGPKVFSKEKLTELQYPHSDKPKDYYLVVDIEKHPTTDLGENEWNYKELEKYKEVLEKEANFRKAAGIPFAVSLTELMKIKKREL